MKMRTFLILIIMILNAPLALTPSTTAEEDNDVESKGKNAVLPKGEVVDSDYFATGRSVTLSGTVKGDAYIAAGTIDFEG
ncbi:MAG: hypothetical protein GTN76_13040, partial [Candidatus Aenigmarchaeota archaeon]|nr:hypothetical protein [Candidatus Aenigmarchaeota archaeon]